MHSGVGQGRQPSPQVGFERAPTTDPLVGTIENFSVDIVLSLIGSAITPSNWSRALVTF
jgi:hypothetical protein